MARKRAITRNQLVLIAVSALGLSALAAPALAQGLAFGGTAPSATANGGTAALPAGLTLKLPPAALVGRPLTVEGTLEGTSRPVELQAKVGADHGWGTVAVVLSNAGGRFKLSFTPTRTGRYLLRVRSGAQSSRTGQLAWSLTVYRAVVASYYGPGFYGRRTACGTVLTRHTRGVASRTLPCGTLVAFYFHGRREVVPVIDRGPYAAGVAYDLTAAAAMRLGVRETVSLWATPLRHPRSPNLG